MRISLILLFVFAFQINAKHVHSQSEKISLDMKNSSIEKVLQSIEEKSDYYFLFSNRFIDVDRTVSVKVEREAISSVLDRLFNSDEVEYEVKGSQIVLSPKEKDNVAAGELLKKQQQDGKSITGTITDVEGESIIGANIIEKGTSNGTITDYDGNFTLSVGNNAVLRISYIGYLEQEVSTLNKNTINIVLREDTKTLDEVVVVGYTSQRKVDLTGAVSSVKVEDMGDIAVTGVNHALQGKMSGVTVYQNTGAPGASASIRIRGLGTIGNNDPLYVIDGMPADNMNDVNPSDIERIDVLKDAASAAIYGSRAANGVVIIQTKKGKQSEKINITLNTHHGFNNRIKKVDLLDAAGRNLIHTEAYQNDGREVPGYYTSERGRVTRTDWQDEIFTNGYVGNYDLGLSGGSNVARYNVAMGYLTQNGVLKNSGFDRFNFRVNTDMDLSKNVKVGQNLMLTHSLQNMVDTRGANGALSSALQYDPSIPVWENEAENIYSGSEGLGADVRNPVSIIDRMDKKRTRNRVFGNVYAQWEIVENLIAKTDFGYDWSNWEEKEYSPRIPEAGRGTSNNELTQLDWKSKRWINTTTLKYENQVGRNKFMVLGGWSYEAYDMNYLNSRGSGFVSDDKSERYMESASVINWLLTGREEWALMSGFGRVDYAFDDRYLVSLNFRADGSSKFSKDNRWGYFPSVSGAWRISEEKFFEDAKSTMQNLKIRASWGQLGNQNIFANYPTYPQIENTHDDDGYYVVFGKDERETFGRYEATIPNKNIKWEVTEQFDIGVDVTLFDRLEITADYYTKKTSDVLLQVPVTSLAGVTQDPWVNSGKVKNEGFEFNMAYNGKKNDLSYSVYGNFSTLKNTVLALGTGSEAIYSSSYRGSNITRTTVGEPMSHFYGHKTNGIFKTDEEAKNYKNSNGEMYQPNAVAGDVKFVDINGDGVIDGNDRTTIGSGFPDLTFGLGVDFDYKGFDLALFFQGVAGYDVFKAVNYEGMYVRRAYNQFGEIMDRFHPTNNPGGTLPRVTFSDNNANARMSDLYVENGNYLKLKNITLGYSLPKSMLTNSGLQKVRIYATAQNLFTITNYTGFDPELGETYADSNANYGVTELAVDRGQFPQTRSFILGLNINF